MLKKVISVTDKIVSPLNFISGRTATLILFAMMMLTFGDVAGRFLVRPIHGTHELTYLGLAVMVFISLGFTQQAKGHIAVGVLIDRLSLRGQAIVDAISYIFTLIILSLMAWQTYEFAVRKMNTVTGDLKLPVSIFMLISAIGIVIFSLTIFLDLLKSVEKVVRKNES